MIPAEGDPKVGTRVLEIVSKIIADKIKTGLHDRWTRNYQLRRNRHWKAQAPTGVPLVTANLFQPHTQRSVSYLTDNNPTFNIVAVGEPGDQTDAVLVDLQHATEHWWNDQEQQDIFETLVMNGEQYGPAIVKQRFNADLEYGLGEVETIPVDPFHFGFYPPKLKDAGKLQSCEAVFYFYPEQTRVLKRQHPEKADEIKPDKETIKELGDDDRREIADAKEKGAGGTLIEMSGVVKELLTFLSGQGNVEDEETLKVEVWVRDKTQITEETQDEETGETVKTSKPKYTGEIRYLLVCSGGVVLEDRSNPNINPSLPDEEARKTYLYDKFPFAMANSIKDTANAWGISDYEFLEWINMELNKSLSQFVLYKDRLARAKIINPVDSGVPNSHFTSYPGIINPSSTGVAQGIKYLEPPSTTFDFEKAIQMFKDLFFLIGGTFEIDQAQVAGRDVIAYKAIAALMERLGTLMRSKSRSYSRLIREIGRMYLSHVMNFYTEDRWITFNDSDGKAVTKKIRGTELISPVKLTVVSGSTMPQSKIQQREEAIGLFEKNAIPLSELLRKLDYDNRSDVLAQMEKGPLAATLDKLGTVQTPDGIVQYIKAVADADPKKLQQAIEKGEFPSFEQFAKQLMAEMGGRPQPSDPVKDAAGRESDAQAKKTAAEAELLIAKRDLVVEQTMTEYVRQEVARAGVKFDEEQLKLKRAELVNDIHREAAGAVERGHKAGLDFAASMAKNRPGFNDQGTVSDNAVD
ncbi:MAG: hypothetical protein LLG06_19730 [Desulfobacteraceae bacterium]|nr:hypothetical protein [Desulfobacteraceae bacterium]